MSRNGSGTYSLPAGNPVTTGTQITATWGNTTLSDIASEITGSVASDGQTTITGPIKFSAGSVSAPAMTFSSETNTGFYRSASSVVSLAIAGSQKYIFGASSVTLGGSASITGTEFGYLTGVTSAIQTQLDAKQPLDALLTSLAAQTTAANKVQAYSGVDTATLLTTGTASGNIPLVGTSSATELLAGLVELATTTEAAAGTDTARAVTPAGLSAGITALAPAPIKAWVNFDGTPAGPALTGRAGSNIASITKNGTGDYTITFSTALADTNYAVIVTGNESNADTPAARNNFYSGHPVTTSSARVSSFDISNVAIDSSIMSVVIIR